jgi:copper(I)-binding protein
VERRVLSSAVLGFGAALVLAGCGAGQITQTSTIEPAVNGALGQAGQVSVRDASLANRNQCEQAYPTGSNAPLIFTVANAGQRDDELVSVSSANASGASIQGQKTVVAGSTLVVSAPGDASGAPGTDSKIGKASVTLDGLKSAVWPGQLVPVTFTFRDSGAVTLQLPIGAPTKTLSCAPAPANGA